MVSQDPIIVKCNGKAGGMTAIEKHCCYQGAHSYHGAHVYCMTVAATSPPVSNVLLCSKG